ncbi:hypothetical protein EJ08DRAFT_578699 [Tothia fuscella]|uniref:pH-response regulator protein palC n=1 Tax=Tothia fuscella TaxID=1048955 RepID=A0A9P4P4H5_9PEZI|nr:hypothetical protein EJ08DRAFT_578699 [Tothia fuscella]
MPYPFLLPTTSYLSFTQFFSSSTHSSLPIAATSSRAVLRDALKRHKRLSPSSQPSNLSTVLSALNSYIPYLLALDAGLSGNVISGEEVDVVLLRELEVEWRCTLSATLPGREPPRQKLKSLETEVMFTLETLAYVHSLLARAQLRPLYQSGQAPPSEEQRKQAIAGAMQHLLSANSVHNFLVQRSNCGSSHAAAVADISTSVLNALSSLALAEATLITVLKDDPYPSAVAEERNKHSKDWMFKSPDMPKVRAHLFARLCLAAAEHASRGLASVRNTKGVDESLIMYLEDLRCTARAKAARFLGVDAEGQGKVGEGVAWLRGAKKELGLLVEGEDRGLKGFSKLKKDWKEKREDKRVDRGDADWGVDAGRFEEGRVLDMLLRKWEKMNDTVNVQIVPPSEQLLASMPSGREYHTPKPYQAPSLDEDVIARMRAPPDPADLSFQSTEDDSGTEDELQPEPVGAFPGTKSDYAGRSTYY